MGGVNPKILVFRIQTKLSHDIHPRLVLPVFPIGIIPEFIKDDNGALPKEPSRTKYSQEGERRRVEIRIGVHKGHRCVVVIVQEWWQAFVKPSLVELDVVDGFWWCCYCCCRSVGSFVISEFDRMLDEALDIRRLSTRIERTLLVVWLVIGTNLAIDPIFWQSFEGIKAVKCCIGWLGVAVGVAVLLSRSSKIPFLDRTEEYRHSYEILSFVHTEFQELSIRKAFFHSHCLVDAQSKKAYSFLDANERTFW